MTLDDTAYTVIGVLPRDFHFAPRGNAQFWATIQILTPAKRDEAATTSLASHGSTMAFQSRLLCPT